MMALCPRRISRAPIGGLLLRLALMLCVWSTAAQQILAQPTPAREPVEEPSQPTSGKTDKQLTLSLEKASIRELVRWAAPYLRKNIVIHPQVQGEVTIISGESFPAGDVYRVLSAVLEIYGFVLHDTGDVLNVLPASQASQTSFPIADELGDPDHSDIVVQLFRLQNVSAAEMVSVLRPLMSKDAHLSAYSESNLLILSERSHNIRRLKRIIDRIDRAGLIDIEVIQLSYADASVILQSIQAVLPNVGRSGAEGTLGLNVSVDKRSNSLLMSGDPMSREQVKKLIARLDQPLPSQMVTRVVKLSFASAAAMVPILRSVKGSVASSAKDQSYDEEAIKIEVDESINAMIITAPRALLSTMREVIKEVDVRRGQVLVEAVIVEVGDEMTQDLGIQWQTQVPDDGGFGGVNLLPGTITSPTPPDLGGGLTLGFFSSGDLRGLIRALQNDSRSNILSTPTIVALDNEEASILVGSSVPFVTGQSTGPASDVENPFQTIQRQDIGVTLKVLPRINNPGTITLRIDQTTESLTTATVQTADVVTNKREISTKVLIENGQVLVLGGLMRDEMEEVQSKIPLLGDIPVVGKLFRSSRTRSVKRNLMAFIRPVILQTTAVQNSATWEAYRELQQAQDAYNATTERFFVPRPPPELRQTLPLEAPEGEE